MESEGRETRFTVDVLNEAAERLNKVKDGFCTLPSEILDELGWSILVVHDLADQERSEVTEITSRRKEQIHTAFVDGLLLGALAADITYERSLGLV